MLNLPENRIAVLDGAMGTMLQKKGLPLGKSPEALNLTHPEEIVSIHRAYAHAGAQILYANTFGANRRKLAGSGYEVRDVVAAGMRCVKEAAQETGARAALCCGPIGALLEPNGSLRFDEAYDIFREVVTAGAEAGADLIVFETMTDLLEIKAALLAAKENTSLPVFCSMSFEPNGRTFTGVSVPAMAMTLEGLGADAVGINCSLGPEEILPFARELCAWTRLPVFIKPNAGLPNLNSDEYDISPEKFCRTMEEYLSLGISFVGGCCGTTPDYIRLLAERCGGQPVAQRQVRRRTALCSASRVVEVDGVRVIGERINPTGKKRFQEALRQRDMGYILRQGVEQTAAGAEILDVNVGLPGLDEPALMEETVRGLQSVTDAPLQLDSSNAEALERGLRIYCGKPIVNSVNGEQAVLDRILPLVRKYGAAVVGLTLDEHGIPAAAEERFSIAERIVRAAESYGIPREDVCIDCLTLTVSVQQKEAAETLRAIDLVKEKLGVKTVLGVSNISFGLPDREALNVAFLTMAMAHGLDLPILNPNSQAMMNAVDAFGVLANRDEGAARYLARHTAASSAAPAQKQAAALPSLGDCVYAGLKEDAGEAARRLLEEGREPMELVNEILIPALDRVGAAFETGKLFLPQLIQSATAAQAGFEEVKRVLASRKSGETVSKGRIVLATVKGDIHDIGKNIVKVILENYGYDILDLGRDVPPETVVQAVRETGAPLVGLSALMTTTVASMAETIRQLRSEGLPCRIMVGGAVLTEAYAKEIGADFYAKDAKASADIAKQILG